MEKLQQALDRARNRRHERIVDGAKPAATPPQPATRSASAEQAPSVWNALPQVTPDPKRLRANHVLSFAASQEARPFDVLGTKIRLAMEKNGWKRLAITSPSPSTGKTTIACNLALGYARRNDSKLILFEFDLRRPSIQKMLGVKAGGDIYAMLEGQIPFAEQAVRLQDSVALSLAARPSSDPEKILLNKGTHDQLQAIEATYAPDMMLFDLSPILIGGETRAFLRDVDCVLLVAAADTSTVKEIDLCEREIAEHTNVLGIVLNQCRHMDESTEYYGYDYSQ